MNCVVSASKRCTVAKLTLDLWGRQNKARRESEGSYEVSAGRRKVKAIGYWYGRRDSHGGRRQASPTQFHTPLMFASHVNFSGLLWYAPCSPFLTASNAAFTGKCHGSSRPLARQTSERGSSRSTQSLRPCVRLASSVVLLCVYPEPRATTCLSLCRTGRSSYQRSMKCRPRTSTQSSRLMQLATARVSTKSQNGQECVPRIFRPNFLTQMVPGQLTLRVNPKGF